VVANSYAVPVTLREDIMVKLFLIATTQRAENSSVQREMGVLVTRARLQAHKGTFKKQKATVWNSMLRRSSCPTLVQLGAVWILWKFKWSSDAAKALEVKRTDN